MTTEISKQPGLPAYQYPAHLERICYRPPSRAHLLRAAVVAAVLGAAILSAVFLRKS
jgi:hypothetical protein